MQDIDFDELDRAVSSLISATPAANTDEGAIAPTNEVSDTNFNAIPVVNPALTPNPVATPEPTLVPVNVNPAPVAQTPSTLVQNRPNLGRAMDFVRPSNATPAVPRQSVTISPISLTELPPSTNPFAKAAATPNPEQPTIEPVVEPVPIPEPVAVPAQNPIVNNIPIGGAITDPTLNVSEAPESPFIVDAKVEKRPLGAFSEGAAKEEVTNTPMPTYSAAINPLGNLNEESEISTDMPLPAELQNNLLEIESLDMAAQPTMPNPVTTDPAAPAAESPATEVPVNVDISTTLQAASPAATAPVTQQPNMATSIPQQYPASSDAAALKTGAIFDTSIYHNGANIKPPKKSNAWIWILTIVLVLIGATIGVAVYMFVK